MNIIPGAVYLVDSGDTPWLGAYNQVLMSPRIDGTSVYLHASEVTSFVLLYAPGDKVVVEDGAPWVDDFDQRVTVTRREA